MFTKNYNQIPKITKHVEDAVDNDKNVFVVGIQKYIDFVNQLGEGKVQTGTTQYSTVSPNVEVKEKSILVIGLTKVTIKLIN